MVLMFSNPFTDAYMMLTSIQVLYSKEVGWESRAATSLWRQTNKEVMSSLQACSSAAFWFIGMRLTTMAGIYTCTEPMRTQIWSRGKVFIE